jgi:hypothetical protein
VRDYFFGGNEALDAEGVFAEPSKSHFDSRTHWKGNEYSTRTPPWDAPALADFCMAAILNDPSLHVPLPQTYPTPFEKGRSGAPKPHQSPPPLAVPLDHPTLIHTHLLPQNSPVAPQARLGGDCGYPLPPSGQ